MEEEFGLIHSEDLPDHIEEAMRKCIGQILHSLIDFHPTIALGALQGAMSYYIITLPKDRRDRMIDEIAKGLKVTWRKNEGKTFQ